MWPDLQEIADLVTFTEEILNGKLHFSWSFWYSNVLCSLYFQNYFLLSIGPTIKLYLWKAYIWCPVRDMNVLELDINNIKYHRHKTSMSKRFYNWHLNCCLSLTYACLVLGKVSLLNVKSVRKMIKNDINDAVSIKIIMTNIFYLS